MASLRRWRTFRLNENWASRFLLVEDTSKKMMVTKEEWWIYRVQLDTIIFNQNFCYIVQLWLSWNCGHFTDLNVDSLIFDHCVNMSERPYCPSCQLCCVIGMYVLMVIFLQGHPVRKSLIPSYCLHNFQMKHFNNYSFWLKLKMWFLWHFQ